MKLIHLSDLHLGKRLNEFSLVEDQEYILKIILGIIKEEKPDAVLIAGDVYDKAVPSGEAVQLFDSFLSNLAELDTKVFIISGNHDSPERIAFGSRIMSRGGIYLSPVYNGKIEPVVLQDEYGSVNFYLLPFLKPVHVRRFHEDREINSYEDAMRCVLEDMNPDLSERNVLLTHQFVTGATPGGSEEMSVGGAENIDAALFSVFDYVALGHIHSPQPCGEEKIRYCGTPLKYSFSEEKDGKTVTVAELGEKGSLSILEIPLTPKRDLVSLRGSYNELMTRSSYENTSYPEDYTRVILTDEDEIPNALNNLRTVYHKLMKLEYDNRRTRSGLTDPGTADVDNKSPMELLEDFYTAQNGQPMCAEQRELALSLLERIKEGKR